jgi:Uncharacterized conserved protein
MSRFSKTWWGQRFIEALETFTDSARLARGRSYASDYRIKAFDINNGKVSAKVRGNVNPYFGVYKEPTYTTRIEMRPISGTNWTKAIKHLGSKASFVSKLLMKEMPENIEEAFAELNLHLLPHSRKDFDIHCSCPDYANPCKHIAGVYYRLASQLDHDPFLLFELRGLSRDKLHAELRKSLLGKVLSAAMSVAETVPPTAGSYYTRPAQLAAPQTLSPKAFWQSDKRLPASIEPAVPAAVPAILIKKAGDFPPFWNKDTSFIEVMEEFYQRVRSKSF